MKKQALLTAALCLWSLVSAQTPYGELPERFRPDTLPCRLSGDVCFAIEGLGEVAFRSRGLAGCRDPRVAFIASDTLVTFMPVAGFADTKQRDPVCRFDGGNVAHVLSRTHKVTGGRIGVVDDDFPDDPDFADLMGTVFENSTYPWEEYAAGDFAYRLPVVQSLAEGKKEPFLGRDMHCRYIRFLTEVSVGLKEGGTRSFVHIVYLLLYP